MRNTPTHAPGLLSTGIPASSAISADEQDRNYSLDSNPRVGCLNTLNKTEKETKMFEVEIKIPMYVTKTIYVDDATSKTDARKKARAEIKEGFPWYDCSGDSDPEYLESKATILNIEESK